MQELINFALAIRVLAAPLVVFFLGLFLYHCWVQREVFRWKKEAQHNGLALSELRNLLSDAHKDNQRITSKLKSAKNRLRRNRKKEKAYR